MSGSPTVVIVVVRTVVSSRCETTAIPPVHRLPPVERLLSCARRPTMVTPHPSEICPYGDLADNCDRDCPMQDCSCTYGSTVLGLDASHLFVLRRAAGVLASSGSVRERLLSLLAAHRCLGSRHLVSSEVCLREEVTGPRENVSDSVPQLAAVIGHTDVEANFTLHSDSGWEALPDPAPPWGLTFGERDRRLAMATDAAGDAGKPTPCW